MEGDYGRRIWKEDMEKRGAIFEIENFLVILWILKFTRFEYEI